MFETKSSFCVNSVIVLMYHRIENADTDPWNICVSPQHFEEQIRLLQNNFNLINTAELVKQIKTDRITKNSICITFDDGYADNYVNAKPILEKYNCPASFFIPTAFINNTRNFWWDELEVVLLHSKKLPSYLSLEINGNMYEYMFAETELSQKQYHLHTTWKWYELPPTQRCKIFLNIWEKLRPLPYQEIKTHINKLKEWAALHKTIDNRLPVNEQQLLDLSENNLFTIGMHTHTHIDLKGKPKNIQLEEILNCKKIIADKYNTQSTALAYPYGNYDEATLKAIKQLNIDCCFTTSAAVVNANTDLHCLSRYQVCDWDSKNFKNNLDAWCNTMH